MYTRCKELYQSPEQFLGKAITLGGWIRTLRDSKNLGFIELNDGSFFKSVQVVFDESLEGGGMSYPEVAKLGVGGCVTVTGEVVESPGAKQPFEVKAATITLEGACPTDYPLQKKRHGFEFLRTIAHLRPRTNTYAAVFRVRSLASFAIHEFFHRRGFVHVHTPIITGNDGEGAGEMFRVTTLPTGESDFGKDFFGKPAMLTVTGQLAVEPFCLSLRDVYTFGPTFRAEHSNTTTHAAEFWMIEPELAFADLDNYLENAEAMLKHVIRFVLDNAPEEMAFFEQWIEPGLLARLQALLEAEFARCTYTEAIDLLKKSGKKFEFPYEWGMDLKTEHERYLCEEVYKGPVFLTDYPRDIKAFYMRLNDDGKTVAAADLLVPGIGELIGGSQREERLHVLEESIARFGLVREDYDWYLDLRRFGGVRHAGYGMGFERCLMYLTGMKNIRDVIPYPRTVDHLSY
ncbi:MAG: asparagine--tRNA ligase [Defluviitaleaceae bacterium]|nr:asparagine--tRNA ligase [Defluviitaleaceae bacterium]MCL2239221.1 asparagine--tRNA ligase [Defluviitaleaceae bacterium]